MKYYRLDGENDEQLIYRICSSKDEIGTWKDVADVLNNLLDTKYNESTYRKRYQYFSTVHDSNLDKFCDTDAEVAELKEQKRELDKQIVKFRDERNEYNRIIREQARKESMLELVGRTIQDSVESYHLDYDYDDNYAVHSNNDLIIHLTDLHTGIGINNHFNTFNDDVLKERLNKFLARIEDIQCTHNSENAYVIVGEILSGLIHDTLRIENNENIIEQFKIAATLISDFVNTLSAWFNNVYVYTTPGNHSRCVAKKDLSLKGENFDNLLPFYMKAKFDDIKNVHICDNAIDSDIAMFDVRGNLIMSSHGDKDRPDTVVQKFTMLFKKAPDIVYLGHRHSNGMSTVYDTKVIESGCVSGVDTYALDLRLCTKPEQTVSIIDDSGLVCLYDIQLD